MSGQCIDMGTDITQFADLMDEEVDDIVEEMNAESM